MEMVKLIIDGKAVEAPKGATIVAAAKSLGITIPTLCHLQMGGVGYKNDCASCRVCVVEVEGRRNLAPACATPVYDGMVVTTNSMKVMQKRKTVLELLLSDHPKDCLACSKNGECELQDLAMQFGVREIRFAGKESTYRQDVSPSIIRDIDKCIMCRRCETMCNVIQTCGVLSGVNRGFEAVVAPAFEQDLEDTACTYCGQCVAVCPVGALHEADHTWRLVKDLANPAKKVVVQVAPAVRVALGEEFGFEPGTNVEGKMIAALRKLGFDMVFDTNWSADLTIMEEASELIDRVTKKLAGDEDVKLPILTSCCPAWVKFFEHNYPDMLDVPSTAKSPQQMFGAIAKNVWAKEEGIDKKDLIVVSIMPCLAKKYEASREEFADKDGNPDVDYSISTRELAKLIKQANINFNGLDEEEVDNPLGSYTGAGVIFGRTGGVIEAATRTAYEWITGDTLESVDFTVLRGMESVRVAEVSIPGLDEKLGSKFRIGIAHGLGSARELLDKIRSGEETVHAIEIMACKGGCVGGGGQPYHHGDFGVIVKRAAGLTSIDEGKELRKSHENPYIKELYEKHLGKPMSHKAHDILHTEYFPKHKM
ncbi:NADH-dependent [FeFe] hydrogenase, group A6 [Ilyobacter polytropus]|uniref:NAD(P)-dependent iron-only hydrogenase catalytic subunit n=1 Tax=Ilyobacter polytropus (strain ATCC 51220 / DSM 2926 / LMG 16218 / CuHBu1) TaxID=572544 RepID=E3H6P6_ILYPC|nr:NADH-dependent [FeFe] hydrogenase, group A6 [Ilyobacter polytropus]ADO82415.1 NAD(P)-dependent iron-only hydrogenase catalytic subunit [Ilyobacter polytropus DSM 2926]